MDGPGPSSGGGGWLESGKRMVDSLLGLMLTRIELFSVELQEEKLRAVQLLTWFGIAFGLGLAGLLIGLAALSLYLWEVARYAGLITLSVLLLIASGWVLRTIRLRIRTGRVPFDQTIAEFRKDRECLRPKA